MTSALARWEAGGLRVLPGASEDRIGSAFQRLGQRCSRDVVAVYRITGGMADYEADEYVFSFWSLDRLLRENLDHKGRDVRFGDFLVNSHVYGYRYEEEQRSSVHIDFPTGESEKVAESVVEFFSLYLHEPGQLGLVSP